MNSESKECVDDCGKSFRPIKNDGHDIYICDPIICNINYCQKNGCKYEDDFCEACISNFYNLASDQLKPVIHDVFTGICLICENTPGLEFTKEGKCRNICGNGY